MEPRTFDPNYRPPSEDSRYQTLANDLLDKLPIQDMGDFDLVANALETLIDSEKKVEISASLKGRVQSLKELLDSPELFVEPEKQAQFKKAVLGQISSKIQKLRSLSFDEKQKEINDRKELTVKAAQNRDKMFQAAPPPPESDRHVVSEDQALLSQVPRPRRQRIIHMLRAEKSHALSTLQRLQQAEPTTPMGHAAKAEGVRQLYERLAEIDHQIGEINVSIARDEREAPLLAPVAQEIISDTVDVAARVSHVAVLPQAAGNAAFVTPSSQIPAIIIPRLLTIQAQQMLLNIMQQFFQEEELRAQRRQALLAFHERLHQLLAANAPPEQFLALYDQDRELFIRETHLIALRNLQQSREIFIDETHQFLDMTREVNFPPGFQPSQAASASLPRQFTQTSEAEQEVEIQYERQTEPPQEPPEEGN